MNKWQIFSAIALRRLPELMPMKDPIEAKVQQTFEAYEAASSRYSQHELQHLEDIRGKESEETDVIIKETAQDQLDRWVKEKSEFKFGQYNERLTKLQYLFMQARFGSDIKDQWLLPQATFDRKLGDQNLLDTARRALKNSLEIVNGYRIITKVPSSICIVNYPKKIQTMTGFVGAKIFYLKAHLDLPSASVLEALDDTKNEKLRWMTRDEAVKDVSGAYIRGLCSGLLHEDRVDINKVLDKTSNYVAALRKLSAPC